MLLRAVLFEANIGRRKVGVCVRVCVCACVFSSEVNSTCLSISDDHETFVSPPFENELHAKQEKKSWSVSRHSLHTTFLHTLYTHTFSEQDTSI